MPFAKRGAFVIVRYASVYGKGSKKPLVVASFVDCAIKGLPITVYGDGGHSRDFVYVTDAAEGTYLTWQKGVSGIYNIGTDEETTMLQLAQGIKKAFKSKSEIIFVGVESQYPFRFFSDITKAKRELGYSPMTLKEGLSLYADEMLR